MSDKIYNALTDDFIRRMRNWALSNAGCYGPSGAAISSIYELGVRVDRSPVNSIPVMEGDAIDIQAGLDKVEVRYRQAVMQFWSYEGRTLRCHARMRKLGSHHTFEAWVIAGHERLKEHLRAMAYRHEQQLRHAKLCQIA